MKLEHLALSITDRNEIERFYQDILGMTGIRSFQRDALMKKAKQSSYRVFRLQREHSDLVFISDMSGNTFEVKQYI